MKTLLITIEIDVEDLPAEVLKEIMEDVPSDEHLPTIADYEPGEVAEVLNMMTPETTAELFGGSDIYAQFSDSRVLSAQWKS